VLLLASGAELAVLFVAACLTLLQALCACGGELLVGIHLLP